jgi:NAD(P)-dependent dehydrogenase (short-subunit alcohol dehydrogenase family)
MINFGLADRVVVVTGGASGIGRATCMALARDGAKVAVLDLQADEIASTVDDLRGLGAEAIGHTLDVCDEAATMAAADEIARSLGPVYGLVASAGTSAAARAEDYAAADFTRVMSVNALGMLLSCQVFGGAMIERGEGAIVGIGSISGLAGHAGRVGYTASKSAVHGLIKGLAVEWGRHNVRVNSVAPTLVDTPLVRRGMPNYFFDVVTDRTPMGRIGTTDDMANAVLMLLSDAATFITGQILSVDGGLTSGFLTRNSGADLSSKRLLDEGVYSE